MRIVLTALLLAAVAQAGPNEAAPFVACGAEAWRAGDFAAARTCYEQAYARNPDPRLLYNLARLSEELRDSDGAIARYTAYLKTDEPEKAALAKARLEQLERARAVSQPPPEAPSRALEWSLLGSGIGVAALGGVLHGLAFSSQDDADAIRAGTRSGGIDDFEAAEDDAHSLQAGAFVAYGVGGALVVAGAALLLVGDAPQGVAVTPGGLVFAF